MNSIGLNSEMKKHPWENKQWHHQSYTVTHDHGDATWLWAHLQSCGEKLCWKSDVGPVSRCSLQCGGYDLNPISFLFL